MPELTVTINGREYQVACDDGQEDHLSKLARYIDAKMGELVGAVGQIGDARLLVMTSLLIADELSDAYKQLESFDAESGDDGKSSHAAMTSALEACAQRIENIAARIERA
ncbi:MAG: cell division protein ZapA [Kiloniellales bacterium]|jgi:cell division protein ZapA|nr:cell division protein ZapA [Kiloniellales bacterium]